MKLESKLRQMRGELVVPSLQYITFPYVYVHVHPYVYIGCTRWLSLSVETQ